MGGGFHIEVLLAICYSVFLMAIAVALELAARYSHRRSTQIQVAGFRYDPKLDLWTCPKKLLRAEADYQRNVVVYRAAAHACNTCAMKSCCTDSDRGRTIERALDSWLQSELRQFHRGMSLTLFALAGVILMIEFFRYRDPVDRTVLGAIEVITVATAVRLASTWTRGYVAGRL